MDFTLPGFAKARPFIAPKLEQIKNKPAYTLFWKSELNLEKGEFFHIPNKAEYKNAYIVIEGISEKGQLIYFKKRIE